MVVADVFSGLLVLAFGSAAVAKVVGQQQQVQTAEKLRIAWDWYRLIAVPEAAAATGLLAGYAIAPVGAAAAAGLALLMAGALAFRLRIRDSAGYLLGDAVLLGLAVAIAVLRIAA
jgi:hypothetical protein